MNLVIEVVEVKQTTARKLATKTDFLPALDIILHDSFLVCAAGHCGNVDRKLLSVRSLAVAVLALLVTGLVKQLVCLVNVLREAFKFRILVFLEDARNQGGCTRIQTVTELV